MGSGQNYGQQSYGQQGYGQSFRGKGPAGYQRSDERLREEISDALTDDHHIDASSIEVNVKNGEVTLTGTVSDRRTKRMAEDCIEHISGVKEIVNNLRVRQEQSASGSGRTGATSSSTMQSSSTGDKDDTTKRARA